MVRAAAKHLAGLIDSQARVSETASCLTGLIGNYAQVQMRMCLNLKDKRFGCRLLASWKGWPVIRCMLSRSGFNPISRISGMKLTVNPLTFRSVA